MGEISLPDHLREAIQPILLDEQKRTSNNSTSNVEPEKWTHAAALLLQGESQKKVSKITGLNRQTCRKIQGVVLTHGDAIAFRTEKAKQLANKAVAISELENKILDNLLDGSEQSEELIRSYGPKELQLLSVAGKVDMEAFDRVTGNNVQRIEVKHVTTPEEAMALIDNLPEVVDAEIVGDGQS